MLEIAHGNDVVKSCWTMFTVGNPGYSHLQCFGDCVFWFTFSDLVVRK